MAATSSPALTPMRPGLVDPLKQGEFPVLLSRDLSERSALLNVRYNWKSKQIAQKQIVTKIPSSRDPYKLVVRDGPAETASYRGVVDSRTIDSSTASLALIFDKEQNVFTLEPISSSLNFNLTSSKTRSDVDQLPRLETTEPVTSTSQEQGTPDDGDEDNADPENPYDYRHFLSQAQKIAECGGMTPRPVTPSIGSPLPGSSKLLAVGNSLTPLQSPFMGPSTRRNPPIKSSQRSRPSKETQSGIARSAPRPTPHTRKGKQPPKSAEVVESSGDELASPPAKTDSRRDNTKTKRTYPNSPNIIIDEASDLMIDMGSSPPRERKKHRIDPHAFSGNKTFSRHDTRSLSPADHDRDTRTDDDVEDLELPSPQAEIVESSEADRIAVAEEGDEDGLAAELAAAFDDDDEESEISEEE